MYVNDLKKSIKNVIKYEYIKERKSLLHIGYGIDNNFDGKIDWEDEGCKKSKAAFK